MVTVDYLYDSAGNRTVKHTGNSESLYFDAMWSITSDYPDFRQSKHVYVGESRVATKLNIEGDGSVGYEEVNTYYYHTDHLGSAQLITDYEGGIYEHIEYTPYGELWIEEKSDSFDRIPFRFTGKEMDEETGLYYYGARYLSPKMGRWLSADPLGSELVNPNRKGFLFIESLNWYSYCSNNPIKYVDPDGLFSTADYATVNDMVNTAFANSASFGPYVGVVIVVVILGALLQGDAMPNQPGTVNDIANETEVEPAPEPQTDGAGALSGNGKNIIRNNNVEDDIGKTRNLTQYQKHHWWPIELGGANKGALVDVPSANPNLHTATGGIHPNMRAYLKGTFNTSTWKAAKVEFLKLDFNIQHQLLKNYYKTQGLNMPTMVKPGIVQ